MFLCLYNEDCKEIGEIDNEDCDYYEDVETVGKNIGINGNIREIHAFENEKVAEKIKSKLPWYWAL